MEKKTEIITRYIVKNVNNGHYIAEPGSVMEFVTRANNAYLFRNKVEARGFCYTPSWALIEINFELKK